MNQQLRIAVWALLPTAVLGLVAVAINLLGTPSPGAASLHRRSLARLAPHSARPSQLPETMLAKDDSSAKPSAAILESLVPSLPQQSTAEVKPQTAPAHVPPTVEPSTRPYRSELVPQLARSLRTIDGVGTPPHTTAPSESTSEALPSTPDNTFDSGRLTPVRIASRKPLRGLLDESATRSHSNPGSESPVATPSRQQAAERAFADVGEPARDQVPPVPSAIHLDTPSEGHSPQSTKAGPQTDAPRRNEMELRIAGIESEVRRLADARSAGSADALERATQVLEQLQQKQQLQDIERRLQGLQSTPSGGNFPANALPATGGAAPPQPLSADRNLQPILKAHPSNERADHFSLQIQDTEIKEVLDVLGQMSGLNIVASNGVKGTVTANLKNVTIEEALQAVLRSQGYVHEREDDFIYVMTAETALARKTMQRTILTRVYRPHYVSVKELQSLMTPLLTPAIGRISVTSPPQAGIASSPSTTGGDEFAQTDALLVQDYKEVVEQLDKILLEIDVPPMQVVIEAMILSVKLSDTMQFGVNFALLGGAQKNFATSGSGATINSSVGFPNGTNQNVVPLGDFLADTAGLKYGFIRDNVSGFIDALESIADTSLIASPQLRVLNKQKAELIIGERLSYKTLAFNGTQTVENVNFLDSGTKLLLRPYISPDGLVRLEVHPERSSATLDPNTGLPNQSTTEVTTNIMVQNGMTVVIGGLIEEQTVESFDRIPFLGALPLVGTAFRSKSERIDRTELIVLITPRIVVDPVDAEKGEIARQESEDRRQYFQEHLSPIGRRNLARMHYDRAQELYAQGKLIRAREHVKLSLLQEKNSLDALRLKDNIDADLKGEVTQYIPFMDAKDPYPEPSLELPLPVSTDESRSKTLGTVTGTMLGPVGTPPSGSNGSGSPEFPPAGSQPPVSGGTGNSNGSTTTTNGQLIPPPPSP